jgi:hypothetical protein
MFVQSEMIRVMLHCIVLFAELCTPCGMMLQPDAAMTMMPIALHYAVCIAFLFLIVLDHVSLAWLLLVGGQWPGLFIHGDMGKMGITPGVHLAGPAKV